MLMIETPERSVTAQDVPRSVRNCTECVHKRPDGCSAWDCSFIDRDEAARAYTRTRWIPVEERLPEMTTHYDKSVGTWKNSGPVLVYHNCNKFYFNVIVGIYEEDADGSAVWIDAEDGAEITDVLAWMPLPEPYQARR